MNKIFRNFIIPITIGKDNYEEKYFNTIIISSIFFLAACTQKSESDKYNEKNGIKTKSKIDEKIELTDRQIMSFKNSCRYWR